jgi:calcineurin-like phosphoesterase family protein
MMIEMKTWFTADQHFSHFNIIKYANRPFKSSEGMDYEIVRRYQEKVKDGDTVYFVGDFSLRGAGYRTWYKKMLDNLPGTKILILGSHDELDPFIYEKVGFQSVHTFLDLAIFGKHNATVNHYYLRHDPAAAIIAPRVTWLCGHIHQLFSTLHNVINVGVDVRNFYPMSLEEVQEEEKTLVYG